MSTEMTPGVVSDALAPAAPAPPQQATLPLGTAPAAAAAPSAVTHTPDEWKTIQDRLARLDQIEIQAEKDRLEAQKREFAALTKAGDTQKALELLERQSTENQVRIQAEANARIEAEQRRLKAFEEQAARERTERESALRETQQRAQRYALDGELSRALASHNLVDGAAEELTQLLRPQLAAQPEGESFVVRTATGQTAADLVTQYLQRRSHFLRAQNPQGGTGGVPPTSQTPPAPANPNPAADPAQPPPGLNLGQTLAWMGEQGMIRQTAQPEHARTDVTKKFGFSRVG